jgi:hypothetical protein
MIISTKNERERESNLCSIFWRLESAFSIMPIELKNDLRHQNTEIDQKKKYKEKERKDL